MHVTKVLAVLAVLAFVAAPVWADWDPGDPYKMHWPQLPDPNGWDVSFSRGPLGDDWQCTETGPVNDIHLWVSFRDDYQPGPETVIAGFVEIWSNVPAGFDGTFSHPGERLWGMGIDTNMPNVKLRRYETGEQRWLEPWMTGAPNEPDHFNTYQLNIAPISQQSGIAPFTQKRDEIYWLVSHLLVEDPTADVEIGWKTSMSPQFMDDGVYTNWLAPPPWLPIVDPFTGESLDLAFVITVPEPVSAVLLVLGVVGVLAMSRRGNR